ncbi:MULTISPECIES: LolA family protein [Cupriavidus]|uniref:Outer membrane lipoprotein carrier protein LolA n=1 Tax=Cupriavidus metallidurans TaxID=119219 RepID=A0A2L0X3G1_9BURK|nr:MULTISPECIES: outer membrane lipoprotein carrier protein LolA [Cupriavidus]AVA34605.1 outer membrane lipoprotein carrier protein LolA [Cupriavidus metallidurans]KWR82540.1 lipoprotein carrier protein LolA [Cupriavidus sp. SHE]QBP12349.1 outer membrane lipoprotein carrier protein LolA [Cupriavidus metallidurans]QWC92298.1 outer membrane lipoprotein carrier protein LolA [Cupriavidus metallidurans]
MMRRRALQAMFALVAMAAMSVVPAHAEDLSAAVSARLSDAPVIHGQFEQTRRLAGFSNPLISRGDFVMAQGRGVVWATREPFASSLLVTPEKLVMRGADGKVQQEMQADAQPAMRLVGESMIAILRGDLRSLSTRFSVTGKLVGKSGWTLTLTPTDAGVRRAFTRIDLAGDRYVRDVRLVEASGDSTVVRMIDPAGAEKLSPSEEQRFE